MQNIVDLGLVEISSSLTGNIELDTVKELALDITEKTAPAKAMNRKRRAIGYTDGIPDFEFEIKVWVIKGKKDVDWIRMQLQKVVFLLTFEEGDGGERQSLVDCRVQSVGAPFTEDGEHVRTIKCLALDLRPDSPQL